MSDSINAPVNTGVETSLYAASLPQTTWQRCRGRQADFEAAELVDAQFLNCDFNNTKLRRARLSSAVFKECKLTGANFEEVAHLGLHFEDTLLIGADLRKMSFRKNQLHRLDFSVADLSGATSGRLFCGLQPAQCPYEVDPF